MTALWLLFAQRCGNNSSGHPRAMPGVWGRFALYRILPRKEFMGRAFENAYRSMPFAGAFRLVASDFPGIVCILDGDRSGDVELMVLSESLRIASPGVGRRGFGTTQHARARALDQGPGAGSSLSSPRNSPAWKPPVKPFPIYLREAPANPLSSVVKVLLWIVGIAVLLLFVRRGLGGRQRPSRLRRAPGARMARQAAQLAQGFGAEPGVISGGAADRASDS